MTDQTENVAAETSRYVRELTQPYRHNEAFLTWRRGEQIAKAHYSHHPSLIDQLRAAAEPGLVDDTGSRVGASKPPVQIGALDVLMRIEAGTSTWVSAKLGLKLRDTVKGNILLLGTHAQHEDQLARDIKSWWRWARVEATWDGRPRDLRDPCPYCGQRMLRVAWDVSSAWCRECGADWGTDEIGMLGQMLDAQRMSA